MSVFTLNRPQKSRLLRAATKLLSEGGEQKSHLLLAAIENGRRPVFDVNEGPQATFSK